MTKRLIPDFRDQAFYDDGANALKVVMSSPQQTREYHYSDGRLKYMCVDNEGGLVETSDLWVITKYLYQATNPMVKRETQKGVVNSEAAINALAWNI